MKIFLGGTCPQNKEDFDYRKDLTKELKKEKIDFFNPVVDNWTDDSWKEEQKQKDICSVHLYLITPNFKGFYSFAEVLDSTWAYKDKNKCVYGFISSIPDDDRTFTEKQIKSLDAIGKLMETRGGIYLRDLKKVSDIVKYLSIL